MLNSTQHFNKDEQCVLIHEKELKALYKKIIEYEKLLDFYRRENLEMKIQIEQLGGFSKNILNKNTLDVDDLEETN